MKKFLLLIMLVSTTAFSQTNTFTITGRAEGLKDSTKLFLRDDNGGKIIASAIVMHEKFEIKGSYPANDSFMYVTLHNKDYSSYKMFWIETERIGFNASKGNFSNAQITGSSIQLLADQLHQLTNSSYDSIRSLARSLNNKTGTDSVAIQDSISSIEQRIAQIRVGFIRKHPNSIYSASELSGVCKRIPVSTTRELYSLMPIHLQNSIYGKLIKKTIDFKKEIKVGETFVDFEQRGIDGKMVRLSDQKFEYLLLEFWFSNCGPCVRENPKLVEMYKEFHPKGFEIVAVSVDEDEKIWLDAIKRGGLPWVNVCELTGTANTAAIIYGVYEYPTNFLINKEGKIIAKNLRGDDLKKKLQELFKVNALKDNLELKKMVEKDQAIRMSNDVSNLEEIDQLHRNRVFELLALDSIKTNEDKINSALILQHTALEYCGDKLKSISPENYLLAYQFSKAAFNNGYKKAANFIAVTYDRYLLYTKGYQKYGTQRVFEDKTGEEVWAPIDQSTTDQERALYNVPPLNSLLSKYKMKSL